MKKTLEPFLKTGQLRCQCGLIGLRMYEHEHEVKVAMVAANNHYAGFGAETSNLFREMLGLDRVTWENEKEIPRKVEFDEFQDHKKKAMKQTSLSDFISK